MKLHKDYLLHTLDGHVLLIPTASARFHGLGEGNATVGVILRCLQQDTTEKAIVDVLAGTFEGRREEMAEDVSSVIKKLRAIGAIDD